jgi:hypothetical protein
LRQLFNVRFVPIADAFAPQQQQPRLGANWTKKPRAIRPGF